MLHEHDGGSHRASCRARGEFEAKLAKLKQERPVFSWLRNRDARWVKPVITLKVKHLAFGSGLLRHATVRGLAKGAA
jgi:hypothetical protein